MYLPVNELNQDILKFCNPRTGIDLNFLNDVVLINKSLR